ncbi:hypothetical protein NM688_g969 [Phlebia brevispora]|uniref:Uncharacterized protein n=1 Tax=Phlebia brevispora TaxID=194682 RepID=A0ACC1TCV4_9APHY|nr:hypothetical protein NM688_g969 [Phlebia brevispora]
MVWMTDFCVHAMRRDAPVVTATPLPEPHAMLRYTMPPQLRLNAVAFVSPQNHPILIRTFSQQPKDELKYHYIAHTSLDVIEERISAANANKSLDCYLGLLYVEDVAVYGYMTPLKVKIIIALELSDAVVRDADVITIFKALHTAYRRSVSNPFLRLQSPLDTATDQVTLTMVGQSQWKGFRRRVDEIGRAVGGGAPLNA